MFDFWLLLFRLLCHHFHLHVISCSVGWGMGAYHRLSPISNWYFWVDLLWDGHPRPLGLGRFPLLAVST